MGKLLKIIFGLAAVLLVVLVVAAIVLPMVVDPNDYKDEIAAAVEKQTGRSLEIEGDIDLSVFPWLGLDIGATRLSNAAGFEAPYMASMEAVQLRVKLLPLLGKQLEVDKVLLTGLQLNLAKDASGVTNWADLAGEADAEADEAKAPGEAGADRLEQLAVGGIEVRDARLVWDDRMANARYEVNELAFTTGEIAPGESFDLDLAFKLAATQPDVSGNFSLRGGVLLAADMNAIAINAARLQLDASGDAVPGGQVALSLATDVAVDLAAQTLSLPGLVLEALGMTLTGELSGTAISGDDPRFAGSLAIAGFVPRDVLKALGQEPPVTADGGVLGSSDASLQWEASSKHFAATTLQLHLDDSTVDGSARVDSFDAPAISFELAVDRFDLDRYLPPAAEGAAAEQAAAGGGADPETDTPAEPLQLDALRTLNLNGRLRIGSLKAFNLNTRDVEIQVKGKDGLLRINPLGMKLYNGSYSGDITLDARKDTPRFSLNETVSGVQAGPLLKDLTGDDKLLGQANVQARLSAAGATPAALRSSLNGTTAFSFIDGSVKGVNLAALIRNAQAKLKGQTAPDSNQPNQTDFAELSGTAKVTGGLVRNDDLSLQSPLLRISGKGEVSLPQETIDYTLTTKIVGSLEGQGGKGLDELKGVAIPVHVGGTFSRPTYAPDLGAALSEAAKAQVEEKVEEQKQKLQEKLGGELQDKLLKGLFK